MSWSYQMVLRLVCILSLWIGCQNLVLAQTSILDKKVSFHCENLLLNEALVRLSNKGNFDFAYNPQLFNDGKKYTLHVENQSVGEVFTKLLSQENIAYKAVGSQVVFYKPKAVKKRKIGYVLKGYVFDFKTGKPLSGVKVKDVSLGVSDYTDKEGLYRLSIANPDYRLDLVFSHEGYQKRETTLRLNSNKTFNVNLTPVIVKENIVEQPLEEEPQLLEEDTLETYYSKLSVEEVASEGILLAPLVDTIKIVQLFVPKEESRKVNADTPELLYSFGQIGIAPLLSTNFLNNSRSINNLSVNLVAGYSAGVEGLELGGAINIGRYNMKGVQLGGIGNIVGGSVSGLQVGGILNINKLRAKGFQVAGIFNKSNQQLEGVQVGGISNLVEGGLTGIQVAGIHSHIDKGGKGVQISGIGNTLAGENFEGLQLGAVFNQSKTSLVGGQVSVVANTSRELSGIQLSGAYNLVNDDMKGIQLGVVYNHVKGNSSGFQLSLLNRTGKEFKGLQVGLINQADTLKGVQLGVINKSQKVQGGVPLGLLSFVKEGYSTFSVMYRENQMLTFNYKTGVRHFYNIISMGGQLLENASFIAGYGVGSAPYIYKSIGCSMDAMMYSVLQNGATSYGDNWHGRAEFNLFWQASKMITFSAGGSLNGQVRSLEQESQSASTLSYKPFYEQSSSDKYKSAWWGFQAGIKIGRN